MGFINPGSTLSISTSIRHQFKNLQQGRCDDRGGFVLSKSFSLLKTQDFLHVDSPPKRSVSEPHPKKIANLKTIKKIQIYGL